MVALVAFVLALLVAAVTGGTEVMRIIRAAIDRFFRKASAHKRGRPVATGILGQKDTHSLLILFQHRQLIGLVPVQGSDRLTLAVRGPL